MTVIVGTPYTNNGNTNFSITVPAGVSSDMIAVFVYGISTGANSVWGWSASGATFTQIDSRVVNNTQANIWRGTGLSAGQTISITSTVNVAVLISHFYTNEFDITTSDVAVGVRSASSASTTSGSMTPDIERRCLVIGLERTLAAATSLTSAVSSAGESLSQISYATVDGGADVSVYVGSFYASTASAHTATVTFNSGSLNGYTALIKTTTFVPAAGRDIKYVDGGGALANAKTYFTATKGVIASPVEVRPVPTGYASVSAMLATSPFYIAHRGGSKNWPEMSLHAYTQSVFWGVGALELSLARTSDGVWFGLHDSTLDRTSGTSGFPASAHTWAEVQAYAITAAETNSTGQPVRPYMRWEELITAYYQSHVILIDPKAAISFRTELLNMMDALPGSTTRLISKYYGVSSGWAQDSTARGYKTWGYFYEADVPNLATYQGRWDILGMDYNASASAWSAVMSYGKPVIGHIAPTAAAASTAIGYGATGVMVSGVMETIPRSV